MDVSFEDYRSSWLDSVTEGSPTTVQLGHRFAHKIASQWLDVDDDTLEVTYCDGSGDGGIDILVLDRAGLVNPDEEPEVILGISFRASTARPLREAALYSRKVKRSLKLLSDRERTSPL
jgi:hypothetical protein